MTPEDKKLLLVALCEYLSYGVNVSYKNSKGKFCRATVEAVGHSAINCNIHDNSYHDDLSVLPFDKDYNYENPKTAETYVCTDEVRMFLRPMSSMTEEEREELSGYLCERVMSNKIGITIPPNPTQGKGIPFIWMGDCLDWLNAHRFDYRGLIEKGLALEPPEDMYKN